MGDPQDCATGWNCRRCIAGNVPEKSGIISDNMRFSKRPFIQLDDQYRQKCLYWIRWDRKEFVNRNKNQNLKGCIFGLEKTCNQASTGNYRNQKMVQELEPEYRQVIELLFFGGSQSAAAEKLNIPLGTVKHVRGHYKSWKLFWKNLVQSMDIKDYIASGVVEMYAMGNSFSWGKRSLSRRCLCRKWLQNWEVSGDSGKFCGESQSKSEAWFTRRNSGEIKRKREAQEKTRKCHPTWSYRRLTYKYLIAASLAALLIVTFASWFFYNNWNDAEDRYVAVLKEKKQRWPKITIRLKILLNTPILISW